MFEKVQLSLAPLKGQVLLYESKHKLTHHAAQVRCGEKWVLQLLIDYRVRAGDVNF